jgi:S-adenosylmethionine:tRNA ribosyltransferase-isomerase
VKISDYNYELPDDLIADQPPVERGTTRLLVLDKQSGAVSHRHYHELYEYLQAGDVVVLNDTKVIKARLQALNDKNQPRELLLLEEHAGSSPYKRRAMYRGKLRTGETLAVGAVGIHIDALEDGGIARISSHTNLLELAEQSGAVPLPPYMHREATPEDTKRYQTVFAKKAGSVAAPTASLNFTDELLKKLESKGVIVVYLTLHVGLGTFLPIRTDNVEDHVMHSEYFEIPDATAAAISAAKSTGHRVLAVGTTVARTLEYAAGDIATATAGISGEANIFIYPSYEFKMVDSLLTNFHAPKSTVLMLTAAFAGWDNLKKAYETAIQENYAFLSYGDSMLIL